jgi:hypothetical protein
MYREILPSNCPHKLAQEEERYLYRIFKKNLNHQSEFEPYVKIFPEVEKYKTQCGAYALSFFEDREVALNYLRKGLGSHLAKVLVKKEHGKLHLTNRKTGHYNLWIYHSFDCSKLQVEIELIEHAR